MDLYTLSDGQIYINEECQAWFEQYISCPNRETSFILDGDLPSGKYLNNNFCSKLSKTDGEIHILNSGRLVGLSLRDINYLCQQKYTSILMAQTRHLYTVLNRQILLTSMCMVIVLLKIGLQSTHSMMQDYHTVF